MIQLQWNNSINDIKRASDLVIVATSATGRVDVISKMLDAGHSRFVMEKMVCQSAKEYESLLAKLKSSGARAWVNTPRRYFDSYRKIQAQLVDRGIIHLSIVAGNEGLGSNAFHFVDLFSWLCDDKKIRLSGDLLHGSLFPNKRGSDLVEFAGSIAGESPRTGSLLNISFLPTDAKIHLIVSIIAKDIHFIIDESDQTLFHLGAKSPAETQAFRTNHVSETTTQVVNDILSHDASTLPTAEESYFPHVELFRIFNSHITKLTGAQKELCPIT